MSSGSTSGVIRTSDSQGKRSHHRKAEPGRSLACTECRAKKQLCDRLKPSCTTCIELGIECEYRKRKLPASVPELEDIIRKLEHEYDSRLKKSKRADKTSQPSDSSTSSGARHGGHSQRTSSAGASPSAQPVVSGHRPSNDPPSSESGPGAPTRPEVRGYYFDESFLVPPAPHVSNARPNMQQMEQPTNTPYTNSTILWPSSGASPYPTRIFTPASTRAGSLTESPVSGAQGNFYFYPQPPFRGEEPDAQIPLTLFDHQYDNFPSHGG
ncbi:hypothetical protein FRB94_001759 [Tulasnella sp. JGI-2019a]|nr:hypothetical protein FRB93_002034 [Tulasnella sp. JGI-2019a]KAG9005211.1 hypothetical protein FRB94_001759 [Tulasnella sp. JGI-2019a]KAG9037765.1 hypothetical protein FRB95_004051 [Tulasnella sp. JGI-2019a]